MPLAVYFVSGVALFLLYQYLIRNKRDLRLPPGPKGYPIVGNVADVPSGEEWFTYAEWGRKWGGIVHIAIFGQPMIIVNSAAIVEEFDKASATYSDRPVLQMSGELVGYNKTLVLLRYGARFRTYRKQISRHFGPGKPIQAIHPVIERETRRFLKRVMVDQENLNEHIRKMAGAIILRATYGYDVEDGRDEYVDLVESATANFSRTSVPGAYMVDVLPFLKYLPEWFPGARFLSLAREWKKETVNSAEVPYAFTTKQMASGNAPPSFISNGLENKAECTEEYIHDLKWAAASMYGGGADTTVSSEYGFFLAMVLFPEVQKKAQAEIDAVVGNGRLPTFADQPNLPYVTALATEILRWNSVTPIGVPHTSTQDGYINNYFIPKNSVIVANLWGMCHDPDVYPDPFVVNPERFIGDQTQRDPRKIMFGFGRRICPGMYLAEASLFACIAASLAVFSIGKATDEKGVSIVPVHENTDGIISHPKPFKCDIKPRSSKIQSLITESLLS